MLNKLLVFPFILSIKIYKYVVSPWIKPSCRFTPTCSTYAIEALQIHGILGIYLAIKRIILCNPWGKQGYDPVPKKFHL